jgi:hypothetical protein
MVSGVNAAALAVGPRSRSLREGDGSFLDWLFFLSVLRDKWLNSS